MSTQVLIFAVEVESDQEHPSVGEYFDVSNTVWTFLDARLAAVMPTDKLRETVPKAAAAIEAVLSSE